MSDFEKIPSRVRYYLLDWKDRNMEEYMHQFGDISMHRLSKIILLELFEKITKEDIELLNN
jgi:hypothetical protein